MKRIIDGETFNTNTSTLIAEGTLEDGNTTTKTRLFQNRNGVYFYVDTVTTLTHGRNAEIRERVSYDWAKIGGAEAARRVCKNYGLTAMRDIEDLAPEAKSGEKLATLYIRLPAALKSAIEERAKTQNISANVLAIRCLESYLAASGVAEGRRSKLAAQESRPPLTHELMRPVSAQVAPVEASQFRRNLRRNSGRL